MILMANNEIWMWKAMKTMPENWTMDQPADNVLLTEESQWFENDNGESRSEMINERSWWCVKKVLMKKGLAKKWNDRNIILMDMKSHNEEKLEVYWNSIIIINANGQLNMTIIINENDYY